eukprot:Pgem_evm1s2472
MYTDAATHGQSLRDAGNSAMDQGCAIFVTEWGTCQASGDGTPDQSSTDQWVAWMQQNAISNCNWALNDKAEGCSMLNP